jgi:phosphonate transport system permease protein
MSAATRHYPGRPRGGLATWASLALGVAFLFSLWAVEASPARLIAVPGEVLIFLGRFFFPDLFFLRDAESGQWACSADWAGCRAAIAAHWGGILDYAQASVVKGIIESIHIAWIGTLIGAMLSLPLAFLGANTLFPVISRGVKALSSTIRAVPEILLAIYLIPIVGLGAAAGALAIGLHSVGMLSKLGAEVVESIDMGPVEAVEAAGGSRLAAIRYAVLPQVVPEILAQWLFRFELNLRASAILGVVGAGGVGALLLNALRYRQFDKAAAVLILTVVAVLAIDMISSALRRRLTRI